MIMTVAAGTSINGKINWSATSTGTGAIAAKQITTAMSSARRMKVASVAVTMTGATITITIMTATAADPT